MAREIVVVHRSTVEDGNGSFVSEAGVVPPRWCVAAGGGAGGAGGGAV